MNIRKFENLMQIFKPSDTILTGSNSQYIRFIDNEGWSNGYIADLTNQHVEVVEAKAKLKNVNFSDQKPEIKKVIPNGSHVASDIEYDLNENAVVLVNHSVKAHVNPKFIGYFVKVYGQYLKFVLTEPTKPVKVIHKDSNKLVGLIMPIRVN